MILSQHNSDAWLSLVERCVRDAEVAGSNPVASIPWQGHQKSKLIRKDKQKFPILVRFLEYFIIQMVTLEVEKHGIRSNKIILQKVQNKHSNLLCTFILYSVIIVKKVKLASQEKINGSF